jgi:hypothetical protein
MCWKQLVRKEVNSILEQFLPDIKILASEEGISALEKTIIFMPIVFTSAVNINDSLMPSKKLLMRFQRHNEQNS